MSWYWKVNLMSQGPRADDKTRSETHVTGNGAAVHLVVEANCRACRAKTALQLALQGACEWVLT